MDLKPKSIQDLYTNYNSISGEMSSEVFPEEKPINKLSKNESIGHKNGLMSQQLVNKTVVKQNRFRDKSHSIQNQLQERKTIKTNVFSGFVKSVTEVKSLSDLCYEHLIERIDKLVDIKETPYYVIKPVLQKCKAIQLSRLEKNNEKLLENSDELWFELCAEEFNFTNNNSDHNYYNNSIPNKTLGENWRQFYCRLTENRKKKLDEITSSIKSKNKSLKSSQRLTKVCETELKVQNHVKKVQKKTKVAPLMRKCLQLKKQKVFKS